MAIASYSFMPFFFMSVTMISSADEHYSPKPQYKTPAWQPIPEHKPTPINKELLFNTPIHTPSPAYKKPVNSPSPMVKKPVYAPSPVYKKQPIHPPSQLYTKPLSKVPIYKKPDCSPQSKKTRFVPTPVYKMTTFKSSPIYVSPHQIASPDYESPVYTPAPTYGSPVYTPPPSPPSSRDFIPAPSQTWKNPQLLHL